MALYPFISGTKLFKCLGLYLFSIEYWFRCMDMDGDGVLSMYELEFLYEEQCERMEGMGIEPLPFQDLLCQMLDLVKPECPGMPSRRTRKPLKESFTQIYKFCHHLFPLILFKSFFCATQKDLVAQW